MGYRINILEVNRVCKVGRKTSDIGQISNEEIQLLLTICAILSQLEKNNLLSRLSQQF